MRRFAVWSAVLSLMIFSPASGWADDAHGNADDAKALVKKVIAYYKEAGKDKTFAAINDKSSQFHDRDLYVFVRGMDGNTVAHGANTGMIGHTNLDLKDADGKLYNKEMIELAKSKGEGWVDYRWPNPADKKIEQKSSYVEKVDDYVFGAGFYKQ